VKLSDLGATFMASLPVGDVIRLRREQKGLSQVALADASGLSSQYISLVELGRNPSLDTLSSIAASLGCKVSDLVLDAEARVIRQEHSNARDD
jgi:transcriptional regulator with XRE-family HTH domain